MNHRINQAGKDPSPASPESLAGPSFSTPGALRGKGKGKNKCEVLETAWIYLKHICNNTGNGSKEKASSQTEATLSARGSLRAARSFLWPLQSLSLPSFPTSSLSLSMVHALVYAKPQGVLQFVQQPVIGGLTSQEELHRKETEFAHGRI